jgi:hypothetical protein
MSITNRNIPIEYPANPDVTVDELPLAFKDKGLRGKAGSAPPFDLGKGKVYPGGSDWRVGRMVAVVMGHTGPTVGKKKDAKVSRSCLTAQLVSSVVKDLELTQRRDSGTRWSSRR